MLSVVVVRFIVASCSISSFPVPPNDKRHLEVNRSAGLKGKKNMAIGQLKQPKHLIETEHNRDKKWRNYLLPV